MKIELEDFGITKEELISRVTESLVEEARESVLSGVRQEVLSVIQPKIIAAVDEVVKQTAADMLDKEFTPINEWGEKKGEPMTVRELFARRCREWWAQKVSSDGTPITSSYGRDNAPTMAKWHAEQAMKKLVAEEFPKQMGQLVIETKQALASAFTSQIAELVAKKLG